MKTIPTILAAGALSLLAACGTNERDRVQGGAAAGAATGAGIGALGGPAGAAVGAVVGGGAGAITGAATDPSDVNLGRPVWRNPETRVNLPDQNPRR
jgi:phage tail tape-measure protein